MASQAASSRRFRQRLKADPVRYAAWREAEHARRAKCRARPGWHRPPDRPASPAAQVSPIGPLHVGHPLLEAARAAVVEPHAGSALRFAGELDVEDARSEYVLAVLERRDPSAAARAYLAKARALASVMVALDA